MQEESNVKNHVSFKNLLVAWLLIVIDLFFFFMLGMNKLKGVESSTNIIFLILALGILAYPAYILFVRSRIINRIVFVLIVVILFTPYIITSNIRGYGNRHFDGDILGLVPKNMACVIELRNLNAEKDKKDNKLHQIIDFAQKLGKDSIYQHSLGTELGKKFFGEDPKTLNALDPIAKISKEFGQFKEQFDDPQLETLNSIFGKFNVEEDFLSHEMIVAVAAKDGTFPKETDAHEDDENAVRIAPGKYKVFEHPETTFLILTRVSEKIKIYLNLDKYALDFVNIPGVNFIMKTDYRTVTIEEQNLSIHYSLFEDVLAVSTEERLIRQYVSLCEKAGRDSSSFLRSELYKKTKSLYEKDKSTKNTELWKQSHLRMSVNMEELKKLSNIEYLLNVPDEILMTEAGEFIFRLVDELMKSLFDMKSLAGATALINFDDSSDSGLILSVNGYGYFNEEMPGVLTATYMLAPRKPALKKLVSDRIFGYFEIDKNLQDFNEYLSSQTSIYNLTPTLGEVLLDAVGEFVSNKLCLFFRPQELFKELPKKEDGSVEKTDEDFVAPPFTPLWAIGAELSDLGQEQNSYTLASKILSNLIPEHRRISPSKIESTFRFPIERIGEFEIRTIVWSDSETGENKIPMLLAPYFGPQVDPAITIVDGNYLLVSTSKEMLEEMLQASIKNTYRLNTDEANFGDLGALEKLFGNDTANITGRLDVRDLLDNFFTEMNIKNLSKAYSPEEPLPSLQESFRKSAIRRAELN
ncbi:MAG: hypothetical protein K8S87_12190, partial [Planctomycetes bacterium]|nr:hypothetical protein [Planctomycetota bacterium]